MCCSNAHQSCSEQIVCKLVVKTTIARYTVTTPPNAKRPHTFDLTYIVQAAVSTALHRYHCHYTARQFYAPFSTLIVYFRFIYGPEQILFCFYLILLAVSKLSRTQAYLQKTKFYNVYRCRLSISFYLIVNFTPRLSFISFHQTAIVSLSSK